MFSWWTISNYVFRVLTVVLSVVLDLTEGNSEMRQRVDVLRTVLARTLAIPISRLW